MTSPETAIVPAAQAVGPVAIVPRDFAEAKEMAEYLSSSALVPAFCRKQPHAVFAMVAAGAEMGLTPMASLRAFYVQTNKDGSLRDGVPRMYADAMVGVCLARRDICEYFKPIELTDTSATWATKRRGEGEQRRTWNIDRARKADLLGKPGPWSNHQPRMLSARAKAELAKDVYPDLVGGFLTPEEDSEIIDAQAVEAPKTPADFARPAAAPPPPEAPKKSAARKTTPAAANNGAAPPAKEPDVVDAEIVDEKKTEPPAASAGPADAAREHYEKSAQRVAEGEKTEPAPEPGPEGFGDNTGEKSPGDPPAFANFKRDLAAAKTPDDLRAVRSAHVPWSNTPEGQPYAAQMRTMFGQRQEAIRAGA